MQPLLCQLRTLPNLNFFFVPSSSVDVSDLLLVVATTLFTLLHEAGAETVLGPITLNFERQDGSSIQIVVQKEVLDCISTNFKR